MKGKLRNVSQRYQAALRTYLRRGRRSELDAARGLGSQALAAGLQTLDLARLHEQTLVTEMLPGCPARQRNALIKQAGIFFAVAITPIENTRRSAREATIHLKKFIETLSQRTVELAASNLELSLEIVDDGRGFKTESLRQGKKQKRLGLLGMRERVEMVNGSFAIQSAPEKGTTVKVLMPFASSRPQEHGGRDGRQSANGKT